MQLQNIFTKQKKETAVLPKIKINRKDYMTPVVLSSNQKGKVGMGRVKIWANLKNFL